MARVVLMLLIHWANNSVRHWPHFGLKSGATISAFPLPCLSMSVPLPFPYLFFFHKSIVSLKSAKCESAYLCSKKWGYAYSPYLPKMTPTVSDSFQVKQTKRNGKFHASRFVVQVPKSTSYRAVAEILIDNLASARKIRLINL